MNRPVSSLGQCHCDNTEQAHFPMRSKALRGFEYHRSEQAIESNRAGLRNSIGDKTSHFISSALLCPDSAGEISREGSAVLGFAIALSARVRAPRRSLS